MTNSLFITQIHVHIAPSEERAAQEQLLVVDLRRLGSLPPRVHPERSANGGHRAGRGHSSLHHRLMRSIIIHNEALIKDMDVIFHVYSVVFLLLQYVLPVILMTYFYWMVAKTIWSRRDICQLMDGHTHRSNKEMQMLKSKRKVRKEFDGKPF